MRCVQLCPTPIWGHVQLLLRKKIPLLTVTQRLAASKHMGTGMTVSTLYWLLETRVYSQHSSPKSVASWYTKQFCSRKEIILTNSWYSYFLILYVQVTLVLSTKSIRRVVVDSCQGINLERRASYKSARLEKQSSFGF